MPSCNEIVVGDIVVFISHPDFGIGLVVNIVNQEDILFADTLWQDDIIIQCNVEMLKKAGKQERNNRCHQGQIQLLQRLFLENI